MTMKNWHWALAILSILVVILIFQTGTGENFVSNLYIIPAGTFSQVPDINSSSEKGMTGNAIEAGDLRGEDQKLIDTEYYVYAGNLSSRQVRGRNLTILHIADNDLKKFPELERSIHSAEYYPAARDTGELRDVAVFKGNMSDYTPFINSVCKNRTRSECYADMAAFEYHGQYYFISEIIYDRTRPI
ncbi:MAG: hypothetical protein WC379_12040 [Methanoregula sp.]|jgi:hypothetical protein